MCSILDANAVHEVFRPNGPEAGEKFFQWINTGSGVLVVGGKVYEEFNQISSAHKWAQEAIQSGRMKVTDKQEVETRATMLKKAGSCMSDDEHVVALAQISGARLLYSNDSALQQDFANKNLINHPRGKVYTTLRDRWAFGKSHKTLLKNRDLCGPGK